MIRKIFFDPWEVNPALGALSAVLFSMKAGPILQWTKGLLE